MKISFFLLAALLSVGQCQEDFEKEEEYDVNNIIIPDEPRNEADVKEPYKGQAYEPCEGSMVLIERVITEADLKNHDYIRSTKNDPTMIKGKHSLWCVGKKWLKEALPWNGKFNTDVGFAANICAVHYGRNGKFWKNYGLTQCNVRKYKDDL